MSDQQNDQNTFVLPPTLEELGLESPLAKWVETLGDEWLESGIKERLETGYAWYHLVAMGMLMRLWTTQKALTNEIVSYFLKGEKHPLVERPYLWMASLSQEQHEAIDRLAATEAEIILDNLAEQLDHTDPQDPMWIDAMVTLFHQRDELEGVLWLLEGVGKGTRRLKAVLTILDDLGAKHINSFPRGRLQYDTQLNRAISVDPDFS